ncbi:MAG: caspase family protein [Halobacteriota archaeon]
MPKRLAVVIGIDEYEDENIEALPGAKNDALEVSERLKDADPEYNYEVKRLIGSDATCMEIRRALSDYFWKTDRVNSVTCEFALFYFSGHGFQDPLYGEGYIAPYDMVKAEPFVNGIRMGELNHVIAASEHKRALTILDCCYSGIAIAGQKGEVSAASDFSTEVGKFVGQGRMILASSGEDKTSREVLHNHRGETEAHPHGALTYHLIEGLDSGLAQYDELSRYVAEKLSQDDKQSCKSSVEGDPLLPGLIFARSRRQKYKLYIDKALAQAEEYHDQFPIDSVLKVRDVLKCDPHNTDVGEVKDRCIYALKEQQGKIFSWLTTNRTSGVFRPVLYMKLKKLAECSTDYDKLIMLDKDNKEDMTLLIELSMVATGQQSAAEFHNAVERYYSDREQEPVTDQARNIPVGKPIS